MWIEISGSKLRMTLSPLPACPGIIWQWLTTVLVDRTVWRALLVVSLVEARDAPKYPTMHRTTPMAKNYLVQNVSTIDVEKLKYITCFLPFFSSSPSLRKFLDIVGEGFSALFGSLAGPTNL